MFMEVLVFFVQLHAMILGDMKLHGDLKLFILKMLIKLIMVISGKNCITTKQVDLEQDGNMVKLHFKKRMQVALKK